MMPLANQTCKNNVRGHFDQKILEKLSRLVVAEALIAREMDVDSVGRSGWMHEFLKKICCDEGAVVDFLYGS